MNLLEIRWLRAALRSRFYPSVFQWITVSVFAFLLISTLFGPNNAGQNFGMALTWKVWWPLLPLSFIFFGRFWCAICPFAWVNDWVQKAVGVRLSVPVALRRYGIWVIGGLFILVSYLDMAWEFDSDTRKTGYLLLAVLVTVIFFGAFFERRTFCRHVCFIGAFATIYSRTGIMELRADSDRCRNCPTQDCYRGSARAPGCPVFLFAPSVGNSGTCHLCANCVKNCPRDAVQLFVRKPAGELWRIRQPHLSDAFLAAIVAGVVLIEQFAGASGWNQITTTASLLLHLNPYVSFPLVYGALLAMFIGAPLVGLTLTSLASEALGGNLSFAGIKRNFSFSGYAVIPLALAGHVAYCLDILLTRSRSVPAAFAAMVGRFPSEYHAAWLSTPTALWIEAVVLAVGGVVSFYIGFRLARRQARRAPWAAYAPLFVFLLFLLAANFYPVLGMMRHFH